MTWEGGERESEREGVVGRGERKKQRESERERERERERTRERERESERRYSWKGAKRGTENEKFMLVV